MKPIIKKKEAITNKKTLTKKKKSSEVAEYLNTPFDADLAFTTRKISVDKVISTGSTLLDLAISGKRRRGGGVPGGIIIELYGPAGSGKTAILSEMCAYANYRGGENKFLDPEARLDKEYARIYNMELSKDNYHRPDTVEEVFEIIGSWDPKPSKDNAICCIANDSLAALSTELELTKGDKMGMKRAKEFSTGFRKIARKIAKYNWIMACTNQLRQGDYGETTPGGMATAFYASLRIRIRQQDEIIKEIDLVSKKDDSEKAKKTKKVKKVLGIVSNCYVKKSSIDDPYREVPIYIIFDYGIDDIRGNLQYMKDMTNSTVYSCPDGKTYQSMTVAINHFHRMNEDGELEEIPELVKALKEQVVDMWESIEARFIHKRPAKRRF